MNNPTINPLSDITSISEHHSFAKWRLSSGSPVFPEPRGVNYSKIELKALE